MEFLNTALTSLWLQKKFGFKKVIHEISTIGYNIDEATRQNLINSEQEIISNMVKNLSLENKYQLNFSHDYHNSEYFNEIKSSVEKKLEQFKDLENFSEIGTYTILQLAGMKYLYEKENTRIKLGWITDVKEPLIEVNEAVATELILKGHLNEYYFDHMYRFVFPNDKYTFIYTPCAIDLNNGNRVVPYNVVPSQTRPVLDNTSIYDFVQTIPDTKSKRKVLENWRVNIVELFEELFYKIDIEQTDTPSENTLKKSDFIQTNILFK